METIPEFFHTMERARAAHELPQGKPQRDAGKTWLEARIFHTVETSKRQLVILNLALDGTA